MPGAPRWAAATRRGARKLAVYALRVVAGPGDPAAAPHQDAATHLPGVGKAAACQLGPQTRAHPALRFVWHHILPQACGGRTVAANLVSLCDSCLPYGTPVEYGGAQRASRRWYTGNLVQLRLDDGRELAGTPNHPVLTGHGWVPLGLVQEGDYLVTYDRDIEPAAGEGDVNRVPAEIGQVFDALAVPGLVRVPRARVDFHGERPDGDVDVVTADSQLRLDVQAALSQFSSDGLLPAADAEPDLLARLGNPDQRVLTASAAQYGGMSSGGVGGALFRSHPGHPLPLAVAAATPGDTVALKQTLESAGADAGFVRQPELGFSGQVAVQPVTGVRRIPFSGHVYNLQTATGTYTANGIVVHNCHYSTHALMWAMANGGVPAAMEAQANARQVALAQAGYDQARAAGTAGKIPKEAAGG